MKTKATPSALSFVTVADGSFSCVAECATHFTLGETKEELLRVLGLQEEKGSSLEFLRRSYKVSQPLLLNHFSLDYHLVPYVTRTLQKCQRVHVQFAKSNVFSENPTRVRH